MSPVKLGPGSNPLRDPDDRRLNRIAGPSGLIIFGVTGDLSRKKLMPAVYDLANRGLLPPGFALVGFARRDWEDQDFGQVVHDAVRQYARTPWSEEVWQQLATGIRFVSGEFGDDEAFDRLKATIEELDRERGTNGNHAFYLSIPPKAFAQVCEQLSRSGLAAPKQDEFRRVVIEKPFGHDLESSRELNQVVESVFPPDSASITIWVKRPFRTSSLCDLPTSYLSHFGTQTTSTTFRSPWPKTSVWAVVRATMTALVLPAT